MARHMTLALLLMFIEVSRAAHAAEPPVDIGSRRELFVDHHLIDRIEGAELRLGQPQPAGVALKFDKPWEGIYSFYTTVFHDGTKFRMYYRGAPTLPTTSNKTEYTCYAESTNGITWIRPSLGLHEFGGSRDNNIILANDTLATHNFAPFLDTNPSCPPDERFKALSGMGGKSGGLRAWVSADGIRWRKFHDEPVITKGAFDSQNVAFWSESERCYVAYVRIFTGGGTDEKTWKPKGVRWVARYTSQDFVNWSSMSPMTCDQPLVDHIYVNQTQPYFNAPHLYIAPAARFMQGKVVLNEQARKYLGLADKKAHEFLDDDCSDTVLMTSRGGGVYNRTFMESFIRPGPHFRNWTSRSNYAACGIVPTGRSEMSIYVQRHYGQPVAMLQRFTLRLDGFASLHAGYKPGELVTKPLKFTGKRMRLNLSTGTAGHVAVEIQDETGKPIEGFAMEDCKPITYDDVDRVVTWAGGSDVSQLAGRAVRLRFQVRDGDVYAYGFAAR